MENKVVCNYCGTIYDETLGKCPLCGSEAREAAPQPAPGRPERRRPAEKKNENSAAPKGVTVAAVVFLALAVLVVFYFIGDMIGWWPGPEDRIQRDDPLGSVPSANCETLTLDAEQLQFSAVGEKKDLTASVNLSCTQALYCNSSDSAVVQVSPEGKTATGTSAKTVTFTVTAVGTGEAEIEFKCGDKTATCKVICGDGSSPTADENYQPELSAKTLSFTKEGETAKLSVTNLPFSETVVWRSGNEDVASISEDGTVTAVAEGTTTITAEVAGKTAEVSVSCAFEDSSEPSETNGGSANGAHLEKTDVTVRVDERFDLYLYDSEGEHIDGATYTVEDPEICEVEDCYVTALASGTTEVVVTYNGQEYRCIVRVS